MSPVVRKSLKGLCVVSILSLGLCSSAFAGPFVNFQPFQPRLRPIVPPPVATPTVPRLGFMGHIQFGYGMVVDSVSHYSFAHRMGLERGDVIVRINGRPVSSDRGYDEALLHAVRHLNGYLDLVVINVRTGRPSQRAGYLDGASGPVLPRATPYSEPVEAH